MNYLQCLSFLLICPDIPPRGQGWRGRQPRLTRYSVTTLLKRELVRVKQVDLPPSSQPEITSTAAVTIIGTPMSHVAAHCCINYYYLWPPGLSHHPDAFQTHAELSYNV